MNATKRVLQTLEYLTRKLEQSNKRARTFEQGPRYTVAVEQLCEPTF